YRPARIEGSRLKNALLKADDLDSVIANFKSNEERESDFRKTMLHCLAQPKVMDIQVITDNSNGLVILAVMNLQQPVTLAVSIMRLTKHPMAATMLRNFLRACLAAAANERRNTVAVTEANLGDGD